MAVTVGSIEGLHEHGLDGINGPDGVEDSSQMSSLTHLFVPLSNRINGISNFSLIYFVMAQNE